MRSSESSPLGHHRVLDASNVLPQQAWRLDPDPEPWPDEVIIDVHRLNLDAASFRQLSESNEGAAEVRAAVAELISTRGKMHNPVTGSGGMLLGTVRSVGPRSPLALREGDQVATLVSLTATPLRITDGLADWDGSREQIPCAGTAVLFARSPATRLPADLDEPLALAIFDVCGAPALTTRIVDRVRGQNPDRPVAVCVVGAAGKAGSMCLAAARVAGARRVVAVVETEEQVRVLASAGLADEAVAVDARDATAVAQAVGAAVDITIVCVNTDGCELGAVLATRQRGTVVFFSMATSFTAAALGAEAVAADVELVIGNGYADGHADAAVRLVRAQPRLLQHLRGCIED